MPNALMENINRLFGSMELFKQFIDDQCINDAVKYNSEGRRFRNYSETDLDNTWIKMITENLENIWTNSDLRRDIESEFLLRRKKPPYHLALAEMDKIQRGAEQLAALVTNNPDLLNLINSEIESRAAERAEGLQISNCPSFCYNQTPACHLIG